MMVVFRLRRGPGAPAGKSECQVPLPGAVSIATVAAELPDDAVDLRKAKPGAFSRRLGGEERIERASCDIGRHAGAGIGDADQDAPFIAAVDGRADLQRAARFHRIARH